MRPPRGPRLDLLEQSLLYLVDTGIGLTTERATEQVKCKRRQEHRGDVSRVRTVPEVVSRPADTPSLDKVITIRAHIAPLFKRRGSGDTCNDAGSGSRPR